jgi:hypothetical protein
MTTAFTSYAFKPTDLTGTLVRARTLPEALSDWINVKDFGAKGDGSTDDTNAIRAALYAAWGTPTHAPYSGTPHGPNPILNRPIFFPAGDYKITDTIYVESVMGGWILGEGSQTTRLVYSGSLSNRYPTTQTSCNLFCTNGFAYNRIEGIAFIMTGGNTLTDNTCCFNWNWDYATTPIINTTLNVFIDVGFQGGTYGMLMGQQYASGWGEECDATMWVNCWIDNCFYGTRSFAGNTMNCGWYGGSVRNCSQSGAIGMLFNIPDMIIHGVDFSNNDQDISINYTPAYVVGCTSSSSRFCIGLSANADIVVEGCVHLPSTPGIFVASANAGEGLTVDGCKTNSTLSGPGTFFIRETEFINSGWASGKIAELTSTDSFTFAQLPPAANAAEGLIVSIKDSPTVRQFAPVRGGGGGSHVLLWFDGTNYKVIGK